MLVSTLEEFITHFNCWFQIDAAPATTHMFGVTFNKHSLNEELLPENIKTHWRHDLTVLVLQDLDDNRFGACRHTLPAGYDIIYRLDVEHDVLKRVAKAPRWTFDLDQDDTPTLSEVLRDVKVWISFQDRQVIQPIGACSTTSTGTTPIAAELLVEEGKSTPSSLLVGSPALSDTTLVSDGASPLTKEAVIKAPAPAQKQESHARQSLAHIHPVLKPYVKHPRFTKAVQKALQYESTQKGLPSSAWPQYLRSVHGLYLCDGPATSKRTKAARPDLLQLLKCRSSGQPLPAYEQHAREFAKFGLLPRIEDWGTMGMVAQSRSFGFY